MASKNRDGRMSDEDMQSLVRAMMDEAVNYIDEELTPIRDKATDYYWGRPFGNEESGRSQVVDTVLRDTVQAQLPSLMRVFWGPDKVVEFRPNGPEDVAMAEQATDYVNYIVREDNNGFLEIYNGIKDALVRKTGIFKYWWEETEKETSLEYSGLTEDELVALQEDEGTVEIEVTGVQPMSGATGEDGQPLALFDVKIIQKEVKGRVRFAAVPPEEVGWNRTARSIEDARIFYHRREIMLSDAVAMGYDLADIEDLAGHADAPMSDDSGRNARRFDQGENTMGEDEQDPHTRPFLYTEAFVYLDIEDTGTAQLYKLCLGGESYELLKDPEMVDERPFAILIPDPEPHTIVGQDMYDYTGDLQKINSAILRGTLDSLALSIIPRTEVVENMVNLGDAMNTEVGGVIRVRQPGMVREVKHSFVGGDTLPMLEFMGTKRESRTGQTKAAAGLDADSLQSSTKAAVAATLSASQQRLEMLARCFAETGIRRLFQGILKLVVRHQDRERMVRLRNEFVPIDPRDWDANMDVQVNVALGSGMVEDRVNTLMQIAMKQEQILQMLGPSNPLVSARQYRNTLARIVELSGYKNADEFFKPISEEDEKRAEEAAAQPQPDPTQQALQAQIQIEQQRLQLEQQKAQSDMQIAQMKAQADQLKLQMEDDRERDRIAREMALKQYEIELKYQASAAEAQIEERVAREKAAMEIEAKERMHALEKATQPEKAAARKRRVRLERDESGRVAAAEIEEQEG